MGYGSYTASDWSKLRQSKKMDQSTGEAEIFTRHEMDERFNPRFINVREARDSEDHPNTTPIIIGLDVTGSMGYLSDKIAREALHETMMKLYSTKPVEDPTLMFSAYSDYQDSATLQVTQFESDIRIAEQLMDLWLVNGGQGKVVPNYLWYFAANHTELDSMKKRNKKGFLFTIGDAADCRDKDLEGSFYRTFGEQLKMSTEEILKAAQEKFEVFHIFIDNSSRKPESFARLLQGRTMTIHATDLDALPEIIISAMQISNGMSKEEVLKQWSELAVPIVERAIGDLVVGNKKRGIIF